MTGLESVTQQKLGGVSQSPALSLAAKRALERLRKGPAFWVREAWRFRGAGRRVTRATIEALLAEGLAEEFQMELHSGVRITAAGRRVAIDLEKQFRRRGCTDPRARNGKLYLVG